jgi:hypothetical protein
MPVHPRHVDENRIRIAVRSEMRQRCAAFLSARQMHPGVADLRQLSDRRRMVGIVLHRQD